MRPLPRSLSRSAPVLVPIALVVLAVAVFGRFGGPVTDTVVVTGLVNVIVVVGLYVFVGNSGIFSFGHIAFVAIGAYTSALLVIPTDTKAVLQPDLPSVLKTASAGPLTAAIIGGLVAAACGALLAIPLMRLNGLTASIATFGFLVVVHVVANSWYQVTNGAAGVSGVPITTSTTEALVWAIIAIVAAFVFQQTRVGLRLRASREDDVAARSLGIGINRERSVAWILSAFLCGVGGGLYGQFLGSFNADAFYLNMTFLTLAMLVIGGVTSLSGAVLGVLVVSIVAEALRRVEQGFELSGFTVAPRPGLREVGLGARHARDPRATSKRDHRR